MLDGVDMPSRGSPWKATYIVMESARVPVVVGQSWYVPIVHTDRGFLESFGLGYYTTRKCAVVKVVKVPRTPRI
jgi:hypothetical protein